MPSYSAIVRATRETRRRLLKEHGVRPARAQRAFHVEPSAIAIPEWARSRAIRDFSISDSYVWLKRSDACVLIRLDREAGGIPRSIEVEYRLCPVCRTLNIAFDAEARRLLDESFLGRSKPCSTNCIDRSKRKKANAK
jgi:hypothetical protein